MITRNKKCPLRDHTCLYEGCQFWITMTTTEGYSQSNCAYVLNALKNSNGEIPA